MPIPRPTPDEDDREFLDRCMGDPVMEEEFPEADQRMAVCAVQTKYEAKSEDTALQVTASRSAEEKAAKLIKGGKIVSGGSWSGPSPSSENSYIEAHGFEAYGEWFLGRKADKDPETKAHYNFPYSDDFENVHRRGLIAIRSRAAQNDDQSVYEAAGRLLEAWPKEDNASAKTQRISFQRRALRKRGSYEVDQKTGEMSDVSLIQMGEAKGHGMWIDGKSLLSALDILSGVSLPAYVTHEGAIDSDRLLSEVGVFSGFYVDEGKLKAERFKVLRSFMTDEAERFRRLFDLAESAPDAFGLSLVFESALVWVLEDGSEVSIDEGTPDNSLREMPSVRFISIRSADFVDTPAANKGGLFSQTQTNEGTKMAEAQEITKTEEKEVAPVETSEPSEAETLEPAEETTEEALEETAEVDLAAELAALKDVVAEQAAQIDKLIASLSESEAKADQLSALIGGEEALEEGGDASPDKSLIEKFSQATGAEQTHIWKQNKKEILRAARG